MSPTPPPTLTLVVGSEALLVERAVDRVVKIARTTDPETERRDIDAASPGAVGQIVEACSPTLFGGGVVVVVDGVEGAADATVDAILAAAADPTPGTVIVVTHAGGARGKKLLDRLVAKADARIDCAQVKRGRSIGDFVNAEIKAQKRTMTPEAQAFLIAAVGSDVRALAAACAQLAADVEAKEITADEVAKYFGGTVDVSSFQITDAVFERKSAEALRLIRLAESTDGARLGPALVSSMANSVRQVVAFASAPAGMSERDLAAAAKVPPWKLRILANQARRWRPEDLARMVLRLAELDASVKGGIRDGEQLDPSQKGLVVEKAVASFATRPDAT